MFIFINFIIVFGVAAMLKHPRTPPTNHVDYPSGDSEHVAKRTRPLGISEEASLGWLL